MRKEEPVFIWVKESSRICKLWVAQLLAKAKVKFRPGHRQYKWFILTDPILFLLKIQVFSLQET